MSGTESHNGLCVKLVIYTISGNGGGRADAPAPLKITLVSMVDRAWLQCSVQAGRETYGGSSDKA